MVTVLSMLFGVLAAGFFAVGVQWALVVGAVLIQVSFTLDCVDGQLARFTRQTSLSGAWLDALFDRIKEFLIYAGLAYGATRTGAEAQIWMLAVGAMALQSVRHTTLSSFNTRPAEVGLFGAQTAGVGVWIRRVIPFPIGERFLIVTVTAVAWGAHVTFAVLIAWGLVGLAWTTGGRVLRTAT